MPSHGFWSHSLDIEGKSISGLHQRSLVSRSIMCAIEREPLLCFRDVLQGGDHFKVGAALLYSFPGIIRSSCSSLSDLCSALHPATAVCYEVLSDSTAPACGDCVDTSSMPSVLVTGCILGSCVGSAYMGGQP
jgi:hypothetical protein